ncbi:unnamed protein product [Allacma fusca]|uniref:SH2 domain-containing protein n=1 Tax=Allacma fusca TaxID=39272 RepID=A0A8J2K6D3_9HEXA|nr:unnamed protein product [Allacma fusca]
MSLWARVQHLSQSSKQLIFDRYQDKSLPIEIRQHMPEWIENNFLCDEAKKWVPGNEEHDPLIQRLCTEFVDEIERRAQVVSNDHSFLQVKLRSASAYIRNIPPTDLFLRVKDCLNEEIRLHTEETSFETQIKSENGVPNCESVGMSQRVCIMVNHRIGYGAMTENLQSIQTELRLKAKHIETTQEMIFQLSNGGFNKNGIDYESTIRLKLEKLNKEIQANVNHWQECETQCLAYAEAMVVELDGLVQLLVTEFLRRYKWSDWDSDSKTSLDDIQRWYGELIESISQVGNLLRQSLRDSVTLAEQFHLDRALQQQRVQCLLDSLEILYFKLMNETMVVDEQPAQVIKKEIKFNTSVRFLCGEKFIRQHSQPIVTALIINEAQANRLYCKPDDPSEAMKAGCGRIINNVGSKFSDGTSYRFIHQFRNVAISNVRRADKKNESRAMSEKFCLFFFTQLQIGDKPYTVWACSVPFVFIVHVSQKTEGWATIFWDSCFREPNRMPFVVPEEVTWSKMSAALNKWFRNMTSTEWDLTETNIRYLGEKFSRSTEFSEFFVSRKKFCEKDSPSQTSFWEWFYACIELTNRHLKPFWNKGYIIGFINRIRAEETLIQLANPGTFLLRFSDNTLGGISITYVESINDGLKDFKQVSSLLPFTDSDLKMRSLEDRLKDVKIYTSVYHVSQNNENCWTDKETAFASRGDQLSNRRGSNRSVKLNYVPANIIMVISPNGASVPSHVLSPPPSVDCLPATPETDIADDNELYDIILELESKMNASYHRDYEMEDGSTDL